MVNIMEQDGNVSNVQVTNKSISSTHKPIHTVVNAIIRHLLFKLKLGLFVQNKMI